MAGNKNYLSKVNKNGATLYIKDEEVRAAMFYTRLYIGCGASAAAVGVSANYYTDAHKGKKYSLSNVSDSPLWVLVPKGSDAPTALMSGVEVLTTKGSTVTIDSVQYDTYTSSNSYTGSFNVLLF